MQPSHPLKAILWDFDGTLADTRERNLSVNRRMFREMTGQPWYDTAALSSIEAYQAAWERVGNWQELYTSVFGFTAEQCIAASHTWASLQLDDPTAVPLFPGIAETLIELKEYPQAVVSQNDRSIIAKVLQDNGVSHFFSAIVGYAEVPMDRQKPAPDALFGALDILAVEEPATAIYIGDHETDIVCTANANRDLTAMGHDLWFRSVAACFLDGRRPAGWSIHPDHTVEHPAEVLQLIRRLSRQTDSG